MLFPYLFFGKCHDLAFVLWTLSYCLGLTGPLLAFTVKKYYGHRKIPEGITVVLMQEEFTLNQEQK